MYKNKWNLRKLLKRSGHAWNRVKQIMSLAISFSLIFTPTSSYAIFGIGDSDQSFGTSLVQGVQLAGRAAGNLLGGGGSTANLPINNQVLALAEQSRVRTTPDRFFRNSCLKAQIDLPEIPVNACSGRNNDLQFQAIQNVAAFNIATYRRYVQKGKSNELSPTSPQGPVEGVQCFEEQLRKMEADLEATLNNLKDLIIAQDKRNEVLKKQMEQEITAMANIKAELDGSNPRARPRNDSQFDLENFLGQNSTCREALEDDLFQNKESGRKGFNELLSESQKLAPLAASLDENKLESDIREKLTKIRQQVDGGGDNPGAGIQALLNPDDNTNGIFSIPALSAAGGSDLVQFGADRVIIAQRAKTLNNKINQITSRMQTIERRNGVRFNFSTAETPFDSNFGENMREKIASFKETAEDQSLTACINNDRLSSFGGMEGLVGNLKQDQEERRDRDTGALAFYKKQLLSILVNPTLNIPEKVAAIVEFERVTNQRFGNAANEFKVVLNDGRAFGYGSILSGALTQCQDVILSQKTRDGQVSTVEQDIREITALAEELRQIHDQGAEQIVAEIEDKLLRCEPDSYIAISEPPSCNEAKLTTTSNSFCLKNSIQCKQSVEGCNNVLKNEVKRRKDDIDRRAQNYNNVVEQCFVGLPPRQGQPQANCGGAKSYNTILDEVKVAFEAQAALFNQNFDEAFFKLPDNILDEKFLIQTPPTGTDNPIGVELVGVNSAGDPFEFVEQLKQRVSDIERESRAQFAKVQEQVNRHIQEVDSAYNEELAFWEGFIEQCRQRFEQDRAALLAERQEAERKNEEVRQRLRRFCRSVLAGLDVGPGCNGKAEELAQDVDDLGQFLDVGVAEEVASYQTICNQIAATQEDEVEEPDFGLDPDDDKHILVQVCEQGGNEALDDFQNFPLENIDLITFAVAQTDEIAENQAIERSRDDELERKRRRAEILKTRRSRENGRSLSFDRNISEDSLTRYMTGRNSSLSRGLLRRTPEGKVALALNDLYSDKVYKKGNLCEEVRKTRTKVKESLVGKTVSTGSADNRVVQEAKLTDEDLASAIDDNAELSAIARKVGSAIRTQRELARRIRSGKTIAQKSGEVQFTSCSSATNNGRNRPGENELFDLLGIEGTEGLEI